MLTIDRDKEITYAVVSEYIKRHQVLLGRYNKLDDEYKGKHDILFRKKQRDLANNRLVCNHAKHITDTAIGYFAGSPVSYKGRDGADISALTEWLRLADSDTQDIDLAKDCSVFGRGVEMVYMSDDEDPTPKLAEFDPREGFVVYDTTVEHRPVFGVHYYPVYSIIDALEYYEVQWQTAQTCFSCRMSSDLTILGDITVSPNLFGEVSIIEYANNEERMGDFEGVISLIDAYNTLQSDRVNDKEQFVKALLIIFGQILGDTYEEESETVDRMREIGIACLDHDADAKYLANSLDESGVEILRKSIENDIHKFSGVPCMSDENFAGNASGVAMKYKLLGFEQLTKIKERYFKDSLKIRLRLFCKMIAIKGKGAIDPNCVEIKFTRNLPANELEIAQMVATLQGMVPDSALLAQLPFVDDPEAAVEELQAEREKKVRMQQVAFSAAANTPPEVAEDDEQ